MKGRDRCSLMDEFRSRKPNSGPPYDVRSPIPWAIATTPKVHNSR